MKILFLQENAYYESIGVMCLSAVLKQNNHQVDLLIFSEHKDIFKKILEIDPDLIAFSCTTDMDKWVINTAKKCKKIIKVPIILGGSHPTCFPEIIENKSIDMICQGEGEDALLELVNRLEKKQSINNIPGIWLKENNKIYKNPPVKLIQNFDDYPIPDREIYYKYNFIKQIPTKRFITGRGCPYKCAFCHNQLLIDIYKGCGTYSRKIPVKNIINEIIDVKNKYPLKSVHFSDDTFILNTNWVKDFCKEYKKKINLPFSCNVRADLITNDISKILKNAGCVTVSFGLESGDETLRNKILQKNINNVTIINAVNILKKHKIKFLTTNMIGVPSETEKNIWTTLDFNRQINPNFTRAFIFDAFPNLPLTNYAIQLGLLPKNYSVKNFNALSHDPITKNININIIKNISLLFHFLVKVKIPISLLKIILKYPLHKFLYIPSRYIQAYTESRFFRIPLLSGLIYFFHISKSFKSN